MYVHSARGIAFLDAPRTATNAIVRVLYQKGFRRVGPSHSVGDVTGLRSVTVIRNHFDTFASLRCMDEPGIVTVGWLRDVAPGLLQKYGGFVPRRMWWRVDQANRVIRYESLVDRLNDWFTDEQLDVIPNLPRLGPSKRGGVSYRDLITANARALIESQYAAEMAAAGYVW